MISKILNSKLFVSIKALKKIKTRKREAVLLFFFPLFIILGGYTIDHDFYMLFNNGRSILENGFYAVDSISIHSFTVIMQQWVYDLIIYGLYTKFGTLGISIFIYFVFGLIIYVLYKLFLSITNKNYITSIIFSGLVSSLLAYKGFIVSRPQIISFILVPLFVYSMERYFLTGDKKILLLLPIVSILEINFHAANWWFLYVFSLPYLVEAFYYKVIKREKKEYSFRIFIIALCLAFLCGLINPYGVNAMTYFIKSFNSYASDYIVEMIAIKVASIGGLKLLAIFFINILPFLSKKKDYRLRYLFMLMGVLVIGFSSYKGMAYFFIFSFFPLAYYMSDFVINNKRLIKENIIYKIVYITLIIVIVLGLGYRGYKNRTYFVPEMEDKILNKAIKLMEKDYKKEDIRLYANFNNGSYFEFKGIKTYIDSRAEFFYYSMNGKKDVFKEFYKLQEKGLDPNEVFKKYNLTHIMIMSDDALYDKKDMKYDGFELIKKNKYYELYQEVKETKNEKK